MASLLDRIIDEMIEDNYFINFQIKRRGIAFIQKTAFGKDIIFLDHWKNYDSQLVVYPIYTGRYDILSVWFERFSFKSLKDQRNNGYVSFSGEMLHTYDKFYFDKDESNFKDEVKKLTECVKKSSQTVFEAFSSLEKAYDIEIAPILSGIKELPDIGADWFFENLTLCRLVHPENYEKLKAIHLKQAKYMYDRGEPNITAYYDRIDEILTYLENLDLKC